VEARNALSASAARREHGDVEHAPDAQLLVHDLEISVSAVVAVLDLCNAAVVGEVEEADDAKMAALNNCKSQPQVYEPHSRATKHQPEHAAAIAVAEQDI
jgi:hypothetical protein